MVLRRTGSSGGPVDGHNLPQPSSARPSRASPQMPESRDAWWMRFTVVPTPDAPKLVEAQFRDVVLHDAADADECAKRADAGRGRFGERVDLLSDLEGLRVRPGASRRFGEARARVLAAHAHDSARYGPDRWTATSVNTSRVLHGAGS